MNNIDFQIKNSYGIESLSHTLKFNGTTDHPQQNTNVIYAQNGVMKSSFAKTLYNYSKDAPIRDHIFDITGSCTVLDESGSAIERNKVFSVASFDNGNFESQKMANLLVSADLRDSYDKLMDKFKVANYNLMEKIKQVSGATGNTTHDMVLEQIASEYGESTPRTALGLMNIIASNRKEIEEAPDFIQKVRITISGSNDAVKFANDNQGFIKDLMAVYEEIKGSASFVRGKFDSGNAAKLIDTVSKTGFLDKDVEHGIELLNKATGKREPVSTLDDLRDKLATDVDRILAGRTELKRKFNKMISDLSTGTRAEFKKMLENPETKDIILVMENASLYRRKLWQGYLKGCLLEADELTKVQTEIADDLKEITEKAELERTDWDKVVKKFNDRFRHLPYEISIENKASMILEGIEEPKPVLTYIRRDRNKKFQSLDERKIITGLLSTGERKALYLLNVMFEIEATQKDAEPCLVILDDVVDSFDYKNKYAFLEYIYDVSKNYDNVKLVVLTHNYDFFRLVQSRLFGDYRKNSWFALKEERNTVLIPAEHFNVFRYMRDQAQTDKIMWLSMIPFARNLAEYKCSDPNDSESYKLLTECLHNLGTNPTIAQVKTMLKREIHIDSSPFNDTELFHDALLKEAEIISGQTIVGVNLYFNLVLSMASRILAENFMMTKLSPLEINAIVAEKGVFTRKLYEVLKSKNTQTERIIEALDEVNLITPEHIHVNSFMYEPLLDIGFEEVKDLYLNMKELSEKGTITER